MKSWRSRIEFVRRDRGAETILHPLTWRGYPQMTRRIFPLLHYVAGPGGWRTFGHRQEELAELGTRKPLEAQRPRMRTNHE